MATYIASALSLCVYQPRHIVQEKDVGVRIGLSVRIIQFAQVAPVTPWVTKIFLDLALSPFLRTACQWFNYCQMHPVYYLYLHLSDVALSITDAIKSEYQV